jgi:hypothetical protein
VVRKWNGRFSGWFGWVQRGNSGNDGGFKLAGISGNFQCSRGHPSPFLGSHPFLRWICPVFL